MIKKRKKRIDPTQRLPLAQAHQQYPIALTERDLELLAYLASGVRGLTTDQIERWPFRGNRSGCNDRLQRLFQNCYVDRWWVNLRELGFEDGAERTLMHVIDKDGVIVAASHLGVPVAAINWRPSDKTIEKQDLRHLILNNDIRISIQLAVSQLQQQWLEDNPKASKGYAIIRWETDQTLRQKPQEQKLIVDYVPPYEDEPFPETSEIVPDDLLIISTPIFDVISLIELDTGSEVRTHQARPKGKDSSVASKIRKCLALFHKPSKKEPSKFELAAGIENQRGVRVFFITTGGELAVQSLLNTIREAGGRNTFWVGRYALARREDLILTRPIWRKAGDTEPIYYRWIGMSKIEEVRHRLQQCGVGDRDIEARVTGISDLAKSQVSEGWSERKHDMSLEQAMALRSDELAEAVLKRFEVLLKPSSNF